MACRWRAHCSSPDSVSIGRSRAAAMSAYLLPNCGRLESVYPSASRSAYAAARFRAVRARWRLAAAGSLLDRSSSSPEPAVQSQLVALQSPGRGLGSRQRLHLRFRQAHPAAGYGSSRPTVTQLLRHLPGDGDLSADPWLLPALRDRRAKASPPYYKPYAAALVYRRPAIPMQDGCPELQPQSISPSRGASTPSSDWLASSRASRRAIASTRRYIWGDSNRCTIPLDCRRVTWGISLPQSARLCRECEARQHLRYRSEPLCSGVR